MNWKIALALVCVFCVLSPLSAQDAPAVITADNISQLKSVAHIDFADAPPEAGKIDNGWFAMNAWGNTFAVKSRKDHIVVLDAKHAVIDQYFVPAIDGLPATIEDFAFDRWGASTLSAHVDGNYVYVANRIWGGSLTILKAEMKSTPLRVWSSYQGSDMLEMASNDPQAGRYVVEFNPQRQIDHSGDQTVDLLPNEIHQFPSGPENDPDAYLRIGRIEPPYAVTLTQAGLLKLWYLEKAGGVVISQAQLSALPGMGAVNVRFKDFPQVPAPDYFAWRDGESKALHLLDFETGEDRVVADLGGTYLPFMALTPAADVIIAVNGGLQPVVTAWDTATGERYDLGEYRQCNRQPDMVRLSQDGTTLAIGCDTGIDIWQIFNGNS